MFRSAFSKIIDANGRTLLRLGSLIAAINAENAKLIADSKKFNYLDLDIEIPISYTINAFTFEISPIFSFPSNIIEPSKVSYFAKNPFLINFSVSIKV